MSKHSVAQSGLVAVSVASSEGLVSQVFPQFGRSPRFLLVDPVTRETEEIANTATEAEHGAGPAAVALLRQKGASAVISGRFGPRAQEALSAAGMRPLVVQPGLTVAEALEVLSDAAKPEGA
jgi:predicted Fe-Mo cluster-binding NifX family protein